MTKASINVIRIPAFLDNYLWLFHRHDDSRAYVVDPGDAAPIEAALGEHGLSLAGILVTHHHADHIGGIDQLLKTWNVSVYGPAGGSVPQVTQGVDDGDVLTLDNGLKFQVLGVPGHTLDHLAYVHEDKVYEGTICESNDPPLLFCGDTLFAGGCGRLFEGSPAQMYNSLNKLQQLPDNTLVYCAHEYTLSNLAFANAVDNDNIALQKRIEIEQAKRDSNQATVPSTLALEKSTNPFLRCDDPAIKAAAESHIGHQLDSPQAVLAAVRAWKDHY